MTRRGAAVDRLLRNLRYRKCRFTLGSSVSGEWAHVIPVVFIIGVLNLMLGFALAVVLERQVVVPYPVLQRFKERHDRDVIFELPIGQEPAALDEMREALPNRWIELLESSDMDFSTFFEASLEILKFEVNTYCEDLLDIEDLLRGEIEKRKPEAIQDAIRVLVALNEQWTHRQHEALEVMSTSRDRLGEYGPIGNELETVLLDQTTLIEAECRELSNLDVNNIEATTKATTRSIGQLVKMTHALRDRIKAATLSIICNEGRLVTADRKLQRDEITGLQNRMGIELIFQNWWREDEQRRRLATAALIDIDRFAEVNEAVGTRAGDRFLKNLAITFEQLIGNESGLERVFRYAGQQFFLFFGDTGLRSVTTKVERMRQTLEATKIDYNGRQYSLTLRAGVTEVRPEDTTASLFRRLEELTETARHAGRNRTALEEESGPGVVQPEPLEVKQRIVKVE